jgi:hypothetical protein
MTFPSFPLVTQPAPAARAFDRGDEKMRRAVKVFSPLLLAQGAENDCQMTKLLNDKIVEDTRLEGGESQTPSLLPINDFFSFLFSIIFSFLQREYKYYFLLFLFIHS